jgi:hypothetical protein
LPNPSLRAIQPAGKLFDMLSGDMEETQVLSQYGHTAKRGGGKDKSVIDA